MEKSALEQVLASPAQANKLPPCGAACAAGADIRGWIGLIAQRQKLGLRDADALTSAWSMVTSVNPFPASLGRVCPHPCEANCNRAGNDGAVSINALERFLGDWGLNLGLRLPRLEHGEQPESVGVIGAGPAGLSFAYQMARRGYHVTVYEKNAEAGGMLRYGIPEYRLPKHVLHAEIQNIVNHGVELKLHTRVGTDVSLQSLRARHDCLFLGIGAGRARQLGIPGEEGAGVWTGIDYLARVSRKEPIALGANVIVVGGGNSAIDAARTARRSGACVTLLYRRTRQEMPAIAAEVEDALAEGVVLSELATPLRIVRDGGVIRSIIVQPMQLGEADASGRRRPLPAQGSYYELPASAVIAAVSQEPDWAGLDELAAASGRLQDALDGRVEDDLWTGGDAVHLGIAGLAIANGRRAAEALHARLRNSGTADATLTSPITADAIKAHFYAAAARATVPEIPVAERLAAPTAEVRGTIGVEEFLAEVARCYSCGSCFGCEQCFMYCNNNGFVYVEQPAPGAYFLQRLDACEGCRKCIEICPCGYLSAQPMP